jgi:hypothetical protein
VRPPLTGLLLLIYRRRPVYHADVDALGDDGLLAFWCDRVGFG